MNGNNLILSVFFENTTPIWAFVPELITFVPGIAKNNSSSSPFLKTWQYLWKTIPTLSLSLLEVFFFLTTFSFDFCHFRLFLGHFRCFVRIFSLFCSIVSFPFSWIESEWDSFWDWMYLLGGSKKRKRLVYRIFFLNPLLVLKPKQKPKVYLKIKKRLKIK